MKNILIICAIVALISCDKDKFETKPQITIKSVSTEVVPQNTPLRITFEITDKEGDVDSTFIYKRTRLNVKGPLDLSANVLPIPAFPDKTKAEFELNLPYATGLTVGYLPIRIPGTNPSRNEPDTMLYRFAVKDKKGNVSDTISRQFIIMR